MTRDRGCTASVRRYVRSEVLHHKLRVAVIGGNEDMASI